MLCSLILCNVPPVPPLRFFPRCVIPCCSQLPLSSRFGLNSCRMIDGGPGTSASGRGQHVPRAQGLLQRRRRGWDLWCVRGGSSCAAWAQAWRAARAQTAATFSGCRGTGLKCRAAGVFLLKGCTRVKWVWGVRWGSEPWEAFAGGTVHPVLSSLRGGRRKLSGQGTGCCFSALLFHRERRAYLSLSWGKKSSSDKEC